MVSKRQQERADAAMELWFLNAKTGNTKGSYGAYLSRRKGVGYVDYRQGGPADR